MKDLTYSLDDKVIAHIAKLLQVSLITGTDIIDHLRMLRMVNNNTDQQNESKLYLEKEYSDIFDSNIEKMIENAKKKM